jgi:peptidoglycan/LPS O-acetylase OafA/YrhL
VSDVTARLRGRDTAARLIGRHSTRSGPRNGNQPRPDAVPARLRGVEGLRALAAGAIVIYHVWRYSSPTGQPFDLGILNRFMYPHLPAGVTLFFTLSGFLLYRPIVAALVESKPLPNAGRYLRNRALRLVPAYWAVLFVTAVALPAVQVRLSSTDVELGRLITHPAALASNMFLLQNYFGGSIDTGIGPAWSLAVEVGFYLTLPLLGLVAFAIAKRRKGTRTSTFAVLAPPGLMLVLGSLSAYAASAISSAGTVEQIMVRSFVYHADLFAFGMAVAVGMTFVEAGALTLPRWWRPTVAALLCAVVLSIVVLVDQGRIVVYQGAPIYETLTAVAAAALLALVVVPTVDGSPATLARLLDTRPLVAVGLASYSLFLWHEPVIRLSQHQAWTFGGKAGFVANLLLLGGAALLLAMATYRLVERPALARKKH